MLVIVIIMMMMINSLVEVSLALSCNCPYCLMVIKLPALSWFIQLWSRGWHGPWMDKTPLS